MTIVESTRPVTGGVDTHLDVHVAAAVDANGGVLGVESFATTPAGFADLHGWLAGFGELARVGVEGTGAYGAGLARYLRGRGLVVIEVDRPNRQLRRRAGKSDTIDAIEAARAALSGRASGIAKSADGDVEAIRVLLVGAPFGPRCAHQVPESDPSSRLHRTRRAARTVAGRAPRAPRSAPLRRCVPPPARHRHVRDETRDPDAWSTHSRSRGRRVTPRSAPRHTRAPNRARPFSTSTASAPTLPRSCSSPRATTRTGFTAKPRSRISAVSHPCKRHQARSNPSSTQPRREPPSQPCALADRVHPDEQR